MFQVTGRFFSFAFEYESCNAHPEILKWFSDASLPVSNQKYQKVFR